MSSQARVNQEAAYILHHRPFRDTSQLLDVLSREHGKIALVARGSRGARSRLKGVLRPFLPLQMSWVQRSDLGTLTGAESAGEPLSLAGDALMAGYYINELLLHFLHRHDPQPEIFDLYANALRELRAIGDIAPPLRRFEIVFLELLGYALNLDHEAGSEQSLDPARHYDYRVEQGPVPVSRTEGLMVFTGETLADIAAQRFDDATTLRAANRLLRQVLAFHLGGKELKTRKVQAELRAARIRDSQSESGE
jgi:DNA repair protein RecO (recombination protein O)